MSVIAVRSSHSGFPTHGCHTRTQHNPVYRKNPSAIHRWGTSSGDRRLVLRVTGIGMHYPIGVAPGTVIRRQPSPLPARRATPMRTQQRKRAREMPLQVRLGLMFGLIDGECKTPQTCEQDCAYRCPSRPSGAYDHVVGKQMCNGTKRWEQSQDITTRRHVRAPSHYRRSLLLAELSLRTDIECGLCDYGTEHQRARARVFGCIDQY